jgi:hypothetical protein
MLKHVGVELEHIDNKKSTASYSICWYSYIQYYKMLGSTIECVTPLCNIAENICSKGKGKGKNKVPPSPCHEGIQVNG